ncbi:hypothetical protein GB937_009605, partial [Aspergillus fischeri]
TYYGNIHPSETGAMPSFTGTCTSVAHTATEAYKVNWIGGINFEGITYAPDVLGYWYCGHLRQRMRGPRSSV